MKISELRKRENFDADLSETLAECLAMGAEMDEFVPQKRHQNQKAQWFEHPYFSVFVTRHFCARGRMYLRAQYRHSPHRMRRVAQAAAVEMMCLKEVFDAMIKPAFELEMDSPYLMWMPGNHRFRLFDFEHRSVQVFPKKGFSTDGIQREIELRTQYSSQFDWMLPILKANKTNTAFEEALIEAVPFDREPSERRRNACMAKLVPALKALHACRAEEISSERYLEIKRGEFEKYRARLIQKFPGLCLNGVEKVWHQAERVIRSIPRVRISLTHGDFQPGNILVLTDGDADIRVIDWEDSGVRASVYDAMTWHLKSRFPKGLSSRIEAFKCDICELPELIMCESERELTREMLVALWAVEEWIWLMESSSRAGIAQIPEGLCIHFSEIAGLNR